MTANNYGVLTFPLPLFNLTGKINVIIPAYESISMGDGFDQLYKIGRPHARELLLVSGDTGGSKAIVGSDTVFCGSGLSSRIVTAPIPAYDSAAIDESADGALNAQLSVDEVVNVHVSTEDFLSGFFASSDTWLATGESSIFARVAKQAHEVLALASTIQSTLIGRVRADEALALADALSIRVHETLHLMEAAAFADDSVAYSGALLGALETVSISDEVHYGLMLQVAEALTLADAATRKAVWDISGHDTLGVEGHAAGSSIAQFIARERFIVREPAPSTIDRNPFRAPYYLWGDGRWTAYYGDGVAGKLKDKP